MSEERNGIRNAIRQGLAACAGNDLAATATQLFKILGYRSPRSLRLHPASAATFRAQFDPQNRLDPAKALADDWRSVQMLFQLTDADVDNSGHLQVPFESSTQVDNAIIESYLFFAIDLSGDSYTRTQLAIATREINRLFPMPVLLLFRHGGQLSFAVIDRRLGKRDNSRDVLEKVTLIKEIDCAAPHRAHIEILHDLSLAELHRLHGVSNFVELHRVWRTVLSSSELNRRFFREIANWYFWAVQNVTFPNPHPRPLSPEEREVHNATSVIRLITRLIFVWFLKEKGLIPDDLFQPRRLAELLHSLTPGESSYYKAILQNLFFATLNQEMNTPQKPETRKFRGENRQHFNITNLYRYRALFREPEAALALFAHIPFLNGGLFECLDKRDEDDKVQRVDGFSDRPDNPLAVPNFLFFGDEQSVDLNEVYGTRGSRYSVRGLIPILQRYKFTITENTPIEEEIALDPELLGQVFENLLAAYNPETESTARKQTGSFYTPREVVAYMVDEALVAHLSSALPQDSDEESAGDGEERLRHLLAYNDEPHRFTPAETTSLINAIHSLKILDPACGSGAFPMGILQKLVFVLARLDPHNQRWKETQLAAVRATPDPTLRGEMEQWVEEAFAHNELDYGRKLYLIENCIYGVDIQPIAVQIAKLRFFISLVVDQALDDARENRGIIPLPNLETKFVAANSLLQTGTGQMGLRSEEIAIWENELTDVRRRHFTARTPTTKTKWRQRDAELREEIKRLLLEDVFFQLLPDANTIAGRLAHWDPYDQNSRADFFDPEWMFGLSEGFDILIGNPPYVRQEKIRELKPRLRPLYPYTYTGSADLYVYFYERSHQLLAEGGVLLFITSNKYFRANYGVGLRKLLGKRMTLRQLIDFGDAPVFTAIAYPSIVAAVKAPPPPGHRLLALNWQPGPAVEEFVEIARSRSFAVEQARLDEEAWRIETPSALSLLEKLQRVGRPLHESVGASVFRGVSTGLNEAFVMDRTIRDQLIAEDAKCADILKPYLRGKDISRWQAESQDLWLCFISWDFIPENYPSIFRYLKLFESQLRSRPEVKAGRFPWYAMSRYASNYWQEFEKTKIISTEVSLRPTFAIDYNNSYLGNTSYLIATENKPLYVLGVLNSRVSHYYANAVFVGKQNGWYEVQPAGLEAFPLVESNDVRQIETAVENILTTKAADPTADVSDLEAAIDAHVYRLYGLTAEEIALIEGTTSS